MIKRIMKKLLFLMMCSLCGTIANAQIKGDVTGDGKVNDADIDEVVNIIMGDSANPYGDVNGDSRVNIGDIGAIVNIMMDPTHFCSDGLNYAISDDHVSVISGDSEYQGNITIPERVTYNGVTYRVTSIEGFAFYQYRSLKSVFIPSSVTSIGSSAFEECTGMTSLTLSDGLLSIGGSSFEGCTGLSAITIPGTVTSIALNAFKNCYNLKNVNTEIQTPFTILDNVFEGIASGATLTVPQGTKSAYQSTAGWNKFTNIVAAGDESNLSGQCGDNVYYSYDKTTHTLTISGEGPMWDNEYEPVRPWSSYRDDIQHVKIDFGVTSIGRCAFDGCSGLTSIIIPNSVKSIEWNAFWGCTGLTSITLPESLTVVDEYAFNSCNNLAAVYISDLEAYLKIVFKIGDFPSNPLYYAHHLFLNGEEIIDLVIPNGVTYVWIGAFINGSSLKSVYIPNSVEAFGNSAFAGCSSLTTIVSDIEKPFSIDNSVFNGIPSDAQLIVPKGTKAAYQATEGWNRFARITEAVDTDEALFTIDDITYQGTKSENIVVVKAVDTKQTSIEIPASVSYDGISYQVSGIADGVFDGSNMAALIWDVEASLPNNAFSNASIGSNFLLYVKSSSYAPSTVKNVVVDGTAQTIVLSDDGGQFYCPQAFTARRISYSHNYSMETGKGSTMGWESIALPFDVQRIIHSTQGEIVPFAAYSSGSNQKPFWLAYMSASGFKRTADIRANEAYIIAMPNNSSYQDNYILAGDVTFSAENITVPQTPAFNGTFLPAFSFVAKSSSVYALNVNNRYVRYSGSEKPGSVFIRDLRDVRPFEAYLTGNFTRGIIEINYDSGTTDILDVLLSTDDYQEMTIHTLSGQQVARTTQRDFNTVWQQLPKGVYIVKGKKLIK